MNTVSDRYRSPSILKQSDYVPAAAVRRREEVWGGGRQWREFVPHGVIPGDLAMVVLVQALPPSCAPVFR